MSPGRHRGFTLIELILVIVLVGIIAGVVAPAIRQAAQAYADMRSRAELIAKGRLAVQRLAKEVREAVPNSVREVDGRGIEFLAFREAGRYVDATDDFGDAFSDEDRRFVPGKEMEALYILDPEYTFEDGDVLVIGNSEPPDLDDGDTYATVTGDSATTEGEDDTEDGRIIEFDSHKFPRRSAANRYYIADRTVEMGLDGDGLRWHEKGGSGFLGEYDGEGDWSDGDPLLIDGVTDLELDYDAGTRYRGGIVKLDLELTDGDESVRLYHEIHVRNIQ